mgnify:FL=1
MNRIERIVKEPSMGPSCQVQTALYLARVSFQQHFGYWLRCIPPKETVEAAVALDRKILIFVLSIQDLRDHIPPVEHPEAPIKERIFLPIRMGGIGFTSSKETRKPAYIGSILLSANLIATLSPQLKIEANNGRWSAFGQFSQAFNDAKSNPNLVLEEDFRLADMWEVPIFKFQRIITQAENKRRKAVLWTSIPQGRPRTGLNMPNAFSIDHLAVRQQALANEDPSASAWLTASPAWPENRMSDVAFRIAFQIRNLLPLVPQGSFCRCGSEMDRLISHIYCWPTQGDRNKIRNTMHCTISQALKRISTKYFDKAKMYALNGEPACEHYLDRVPGVRIPTDEPIVPGQPDSRNPMAKRRADFGFSGIARTILVDVATTSPLAKEVKDYRPGSAADVGTKKKAREYSKWFQIHKTDRCNIFFFGIETSGGLGKEARQYVKLLARLAGGPMGVEIQRIYQRIAVELQTARANQVYITRNRFVLHHPPPHPGS